ncbi:MAG TPA: hypothetical protein VJ842_14085 [Pyrinomonadaceae bacterium]|nr:hypothetical protein [Pyrinomonadaceae bacterium]
MTGYFSRLAQRTGLGFATPNARKASGGLAPSQESLREPSHAPAPLHTEEFTFISQPHTDAPASLTQSAEKEFRDDMRERTGEHIHAPRADARVGNSIPESPTLLASDENEPEMPRRQRTDSERHFQSFTEETEIHAATSGPQHRLARAQENYESVDDISESPRRTNAAESLPFATNQARRREPQHRVETREAPDDFDAPLEREAIGGMSREEVYQNYLREVRKWVAEETPAALDEDALQQPSLVAASAAAGAAGALAVGRERELDTQDFNLSIGTISIVVEEPAAQTVMQTTPPARAERAQAPRAASSSSRNYLRFK